MEQLQLYTNLTTLPDYTFLLGLHCKDPCSLFWLFLYFKCHSLFTYRDTEHGVDRRQLLYYVYLIEELFKTVFPLIGTRKKNLEAL